MTAPDIPPATTAVLHRAYAPPRPEASRGFSGADALGAELPDTLDVTGGVVRVGDEHNAGLLVDDATFTVGISADGWSMTVCWTTPGAGTVELSASAAPAAVAIHRCAIAAGDDWPIIGTGSLDVVDAPQRRTRAALADIVIDSAVDRFLELGRTLSHLGWPTGID